MIIDEDKTLTMTTLMSTLSTVSSPTFEDLWTKSRKSNVIVFSSDTIAEKPRNIEYWRALNAQCESNMAIIKRTSPINNINTVYDVKNMV